MKIVYMSECMSETSDISSSGVTNFNWILNENINSVYVTQLSEHKTLECLKNNYVASADKNAKCSKL